jgi:uncharacterized protein (TIGR03437 family)
LSRPGKKRIVRGPAADRTGRRPRKEETMNWKIAFVLVACVASLVAQTPPVTILELEIEDYVTYYHDVADPAKIATSPAIVPLAPNYNWVFKWAIGIGDIMAVNGMLAKGSRMSRFNSPRYISTFTPGRALADIDGNCMGDTHWAILRPDGTPVGTIFGLGYGGMAAPPGAPAATRTHNWTVVGGTGAFLGVRGQGGRGQVTTGGRSASMVEDPAYRRTNRGGRHREIIHLIPMTWPEVLALSTGPAVFHSADFSPVTADKPARPGEQLIVRATGLGPVRPNLDPGKPFPPYPEGILHEVNSPVDVTVNGKAAAVINKYGWPATANVYRVDFVVPDGTAAGMATLGLSAAWINGPEVKIPVR